MIREGMILSDRYEIISKIGTGGMSDVYKAKDHKLNRFVAVKVLKAEFSENKSFVSKFRVEAQSAAGLMHPNIVNVYDVGEEDGMHFMVMELVEGITLKHYIEKKLRLSVKEAISIAIQVSMGIESAHNNHIIHRDIKPQNIIISKEGKVKVTDFGIARAATSDTITSNAMGSVHYTSPEQARGGYSDEKSDIYSLGITMFEMLTGRVPFDGETTVAIAIQHIQEPLPSPRSFVDDIPVSVEQIIFKCCQKNPDRRYQSMTELIVDLKKSLITPDEDFVKMVPLGGYHAETKMISDDDMEVIKRKTDRVDFGDDDVLRAYERPKAKRIPEEERPKTKTPSSKTTKKSAKKSSRYYEEYDEEEDDEDDMDPKMEKLMMVLGVVAAVIIGLIALFLVGRVFGLFKATPSGISENSISSEMVEMIDVRGMTFDEAKQKIQNMDLKVQATYEPSSTILKDYVISQNVEPGSRVAKGGVVELTVSSGKDGIAVPSVIGKSEAEAKVALETEGFVMQKQTSASDSVAKGNVISQTPSEGESAAKGSTVTVVISTGKSTNSVTVPDIRLHTEADAKALLTAAGLTWSTIDEDYSDTVPVGCVISQSYSPNLTVDEGTSVNFTLSLGPKTVVYKCNFSVNAPPTYQGGPATVTLTQDGTNTVLFSTTTTTFPVGINLSNITGGGTGVITIHYTITSTVVNENEDGTTSSETKSEEKSDYQQVTFTAQE